MIVLNTEMKAFDTHVHTIRKHSIADSIKSFEQGFKWAGVEKFVFLCVLYESKENFDILNNLKGLFYKKYFSPNAYAFAALEHKTGLSDEQLANDFLDQAQLYMRVGFDGMKMLEGKPGLRKDFGKLLSSSVYDKFFAFMEECQKPITLHNADPGYFWDESKLSKEALDRGWLVGKDQLSKEEMFRDVMNVLKKYPKLRLTLAHFGFTAESIEEAKEFLENYENTSFDITPGGEQLIYMQQNPDLWIPFLERHADRIKYGSDTYNHVCPNEEELRFHKLYRPNLIRNFFEGDGIYEYDSWTYHGINFDRELLKKIYFENAERELGSPTSIDMSYVKNEISRFEAIVSTDLDMEDIKFIKDNF